MKMELTDPTSLQRRAPAGLPFDKKEATPPLASERVDQFQQFPMKSEPRVASLSTALIPVNLVAANRHLARGGKGDCREIESIGGHHVLSDFPAVGRSIGRRAGTTPASIVAAQSTATGVRDCAQLYHLVAPRRSYWRSPQGRVIATAATSAPGGTCCGAGGACARNCCAE